VLLDDVSFCASPEVADSGGDDSIPTNSFRLIVSVIGSLLYWLSLSCGEETNVGYTSEGSYVNEGSTYAES